MVLVTLIAAMVILSLLAALAPILLVAAAWHAQRLDSAAKVAAMDRIVTPTRRFGRLRR